MDKSWRIELKNCFMLHFGHLNKKLRLAAFIDINRLKNNPECGEELLKEVYEKAFNKYIRNRKKCGCMFVSIKFFRLNKKKFIPLYSDTMENRVLVKLK